MSARSLAMIAALLPLGFFAINGAEKYGDVWQIVTMVVVICFGGMLGKVLAMADSVDD